MTIDRQVTRPDAILRGEERGSGRTLLLLHAGLERRRVWTPVTDVLVRAGFRCVAYDQRGHGESTGTSRVLGPHADDVVAMLDAEHDGCVVVGASLGGLAAMAAVGDPAVRARTAGLVLVDVVPDPDPERSRAYLSARGLFDGHVAMHDDVVAWAPRLRRSVAAFRRPVLLVRGSGSPVDDAAADRLVGLAPQATVTRVAGAGHLVARDRPVELAETVAAAVAGWPALAVRPIR